MKGIIAFSILAVVCTFVSGAPALGQERPPAWAYPVNPPDFKSPPGDGTLRRVPDSDLALTLTQVRDRFYAPDWHPGDHPPMPEVVARGRKPGVFACGYCHRADGPGGPENSSLAGLPAEYIIQQVADFKNGVRRSSVPERIPAALMASLSKAATEADVLSAAAYFSGLKPRRVITVIETDMVPKTYVAGWFLAVANDKDKEPLGQRIIEVPKDLERFESRDARSEFIAYVPAGSVAKGERLVTTGGDNRTTQCGICHGPDLKGLGPIPGIAGRSPSYIFRQLYDLQHGERTGPWSPLMAGVVAKFNEEDLVSLAAYLASREP
jgi:cytochrome c553